MIFLVSQRFRKPRKSRQNCESDAICLISVDDRHQVGSLSLAQNIKSFNELHECLITQVSRRQRIDASVINIIRLSSRRRQSIFSRDNKYQSAKWKK